MKIALPFEYSHCLPFECGHFLHLEALHLSDGAESVGQFGQAVLLEAREQDAQVLRTLSVHQRLLCLLRI